MFWGPGIWGPVLAFQCLTRPALGKKPESCMRAFASKRKSPAQGGRGFAAGLLATASAVLT